MKNTTKHHSQRIFGMLLLGLCSSACVEFETAPCDKGQLINVGGYSDTRWMNLFDSENMEVLSVEEEGRKKMGTGLYGDGEEVLVRTCKLGNRIFAESKNDDGKFELSALNVLPGKIILSPVMISSSTLDALNIPYHIEYRSASSHTKLMKQLKIEENVWNKFSMLKSSNDLSKVLVIEEIPSSSAAAALWRKLQEGPLVVQTLAQP